MHEASTSGETAALKAVHGQVGHKQEKGYDDVPVHFKYHA